MVNRHLLCSTPVGVIEKNTPWTSPARIFWLMCSTPVGVIDKKKPAAWCQPSFEINCAQRLSASSRKTPDTGLDLCVASVLCSTPVGVIEKNTKDNGPIPGLSERVLNACRRHRE